MFGCALASFVLCKLSKTVELSRTKATAWILKIVAYQMQLDRLKDREENRGSGKCALDIDINDIAYLMKDVWQRRDARALAKSGDDFGDDAVEGVEQPRVLSLGRDETVEHR